MIVHHDLTVCREDLGVWQRRQVWPRENRRYQPFLFGRNHKGYRWCGHHYYYNQAVREDRILWLWIRLHNGKRNLTTGERK